MHLYATGFRRSIMHPSAAKTPRSTPAGASKEGCSGRTPPPYLRAQILPKEVPLGGSAHHLLALLVAAAANGVVEGKGNLLLGRECVALHERAGYHGDVNLEVDLELL